MRRVQSEKPGPWQDSSLLDGGGYRGPGRLKVRTTRENRQHLRLVVTEYGSDTFKVESFGDLHPGSNTVDLVFGTPGTSEEDQHTMKRQDAPRESGRESCGEQRGVQHLLTLQHANARATRAGPSGAAGTAGIALFQPTLSQPTASQHT
ncbi:unnamed protein product [Pylaiella littoralis]